MREIDLEPGSKEKPIRAYDPSGPYTDPAVAIDIRAGLAPMREKWILARGDVERYVGRDVRPEDNGLDGKETSPVPLFDRAGRQPLRAKGGKSVTQLAYARAGIITPEMEYIAIRENLGRREPEARSDRRELRRLDPRFLHAGIRARRDRARPRHHPRQHQSSGKRADDHRPEFPGEDQRQYRQFHRHLVGGRGSRQAGLGDPLGRRHGDGSVDRQEHPHHPRMDHPQLAGADRHGADLSGAGEGRRQGRGSDLGSVPRHADRAVRAGRRLLHHPCRRAARLHPADGEARHRHRLARRLDHGEVVPRASQGEFPLHALRGNLRDHEGL